MTTAADNRLPVALLTGFLGAGKTTLLNFVLKHPDMAGTAIVINEYGTVGIDHHLVEAAEDDTTLIADGCMCCTARGEIRSAMLKLHDRAQAAGMRLKRVVIETTGLAEPGPILTEILRLPDLSQRFRMDSVVTVVDALNGPPTLASHDIAVQQITAADRILVSKADLVEAAELEELRGRLVAVNPDATIEVLKPGSLQPGQLFSGARQHSGSGFSLGSWFESADQIRMTPTTSHLLQNPTRTPEDQDIQTFSLILEEPVPEWQLYGWIEFLRTLCGPTLLRFKGLVNVQGQPGPAVLHGVQKALHPVRHLPDWPSEDTRTRLVFITRGWGQAVVASTLAYLREIPRKA